MDIIGAAAVSGLAGRPQSLGGDAVGPVDGAGVLEDANMQLLSTPSISRWV